MRVEYEVGVHTYKEWVCFGHEGYAGQKAALWWMSKGGNTPVPATVDEAISRFSAKELREIEAIRIRREGEYDRVAGVRTAPRGRDLFGEVA